MGLLAYSGAERCGYGGMAAEGVEGPDEAPDWFLALCEEDGEVAAGVNKLDLQLGDPGAAEGLREMAREFRARPVIWEPRTREILERDLHTQPVKPVRRGERV